MWTRFPGLGCVDKLLIPTDLSDRHHKITLKMILWTCVRATDIINPALLILLIKSVGVAFNNLKEL